MMAVADACYANDFGCSLSQLGLREMIEENRRCEVAPLTSVAEERWTCTCVSEGQDVLLCRPLHKPMGFSLASFFWFP